MASNEIHVNDIGTVFTLNVYDEDSSAVDLSSASVDILFKKPDNTLLTQSGTISSGTGGEVTYTTVSGDLNLHGTWSIQALVTLGSNQFYSDVNQFKVYRNLT